MKWTGPVLVALLATMFCGCSLAPEPEIVFRREAPDLNTAPEHPVPELGEGDHAIVLLADGDRFEAEYRGFTEGVFEFEDVEWDERLERDPSPTLRCALDDVSEIRRQDWGSADTIVAWTSIAVGVVAIAVYGHGDG